jgi:hypothetical protein
MPEQPVQQPVQDVGTEVERAVTRSLDAWMSGESPPVDLEALAARASGARLATAVVQIPALRALFAIEAGDAAAGLACARRASLMGRTEAIPAAEWLANLALARARRYNRQIHLAVRILEALDPPASPSGRTWLDWERLLAGAVVPEGRAAGGGPAAALSNLLLAAQTGDRGGFARHAGALAASGTIAPFRREASALVEALNPFDVPPPEVPSEARERDDPASEQLRAWRQGEAPLPPALLHGLLLPASPEPGACVVLWPDGRSARFLSAGLPLLGSGVARLPPSRRQNGRIETLLAVLALAGPHGLDEATCFFRAYGFTYVPGLHRGVFDVLVHRARGAVDGLATLARGPGRLALTATRPLLLFDPRASRSTTDRVLRLLAEQGRASAKEAAARLGLSLRAAQGALSELAGNHACVVERDGRSITYAVEDSVFSEPTGRLSRGRVSRRDELGAAGA